MWCLHPLIEFVDVSLCFPVPVTSLLVLPPIRSNHPGRGGFARGRGHILSRPTAPYPQRGGYGFGRHGSNLCEI
jgi:hypothetical protein